jgi:hypothetical protein
MDMTKLNADLTAATAALSAVSMAFPIAIAAYTVLKGIWQSTNPGKPEADYLAYLQTASQANIDDTSARLIADGYVASADGKTWTKP